jgi:hypothetical protein
MLRAFLSFIAEDVMLVNLFRGQAKNQNNDLEFADCSVKEAMGQCECRLYSRQVEEAHAGPANDQRRATELGRHRSEDARRLGVRPAPGARLPELGRFIRSGATRHNKVTSPQPSKSLRL